MNSNKIQIKEILARYFPSFSPELSDDIAEVAELMSMPSGETMMDVGRYIKMVPLLHKGMVKIFREDEQGNELFLYYLYPGEACAISFVCSLRERKSNVKALVVRDSEFIAFPIKYMDEWMLKHQTWYHFVLEAFNFRFEEVLKTIDEIAFHRMDDRLENYLIKIAQADGTRILYTSHQDIANELNSSREVISRLLKKMEKEGMVKLGRGKIELVSLLTI